MSFLRKLSGWISALNMILVGLPRVPSMTRLGWRSAADQPRTSRTRRCSAGRNHLHVFFARAARFVLDTWCHSSHEVLHRASRVTSRYRRPKYGKRATGIYARMTFSCFSAVTAQVPIFGRCDQAGYTPALVLVADRPSSSSARVLIEQLRRF
jgi:hypothetical protein